MRYSKDMLHVKISGNGPPLVLVHGILSDSHYWTPVKASLESRYQVIAVDLYGFGDSPKPARGYSLDEQADALARAIEHATDTPAVVVAHSMGCLVAARMAHTHAALATRLVLLNPPINKSDVEVVDALKNTGAFYRLALYSPVGHFIWPLAKFLARFSRYKLFKYMTPSHTHRSRQGSLRLVESTRIHQLLEPLTLPVDIVNGSYDRPEYKANLQLIPTKPNIHVHTVETGHHTIYREPSALLDLL